MMLHTRLVRPLWQSAVLRGMTAEPHAPLISRAAWPTASRSYFHAAASGVYRSSFSAVSNRHPAPILMPPKRRFHVTRAVLAHLPMTKEFVEERIILTLKLYDKVDHAKLHLDADFQKDLGLDSLDHVEIVFAMEEEFYFEIPDVDAERMHTPRDIAQYVCDKEEIYS